MARICRVVALGAAVVLLAGVRVDGVEEDVGVDVFLVYMDADDRLVAGQVLCGKFLCNLQGQLWCDLAGAEGLDHVIILDSVLFSIVPFGLQHLPHLPARLTVQTGGEDLLLGLIPIEDVTNAYVQAALPGQDLGDRHLLFRHLVHQLIDLIQQVQPALGILRPGDPCVDTAGNLVDVVSDVMDLCAQGTDFLEGRALTGFPSISRTRKARLVRPHSRACQRSSWYCCCVSSM